MNRRKRHIALPQRESKIVTENRRTVCTTSDSPDNRYSKFVPRDKLTNK